MRSVVRWLGTGVGLAAASYAIYVGVTWYRYGRVRYTSSDEAADPLLDRFIPDYQVVERHQVPVGAPAETTLSAAAEMDLQQSGVIRGIFKARELILGSQPAPMGPRAFLSQMEALGWGILADTPGREIVVGAVTQPWMANVVFRALPADEFATFHEPGYVKIVWTLRADPVGTTESVFRTETRAMTTDPTALAKFRRYWSFAQPGIWLIRRSSLDLVKREAERRARLAQREQRRAEPTECTQ
jgi:hypothetical protein